MTFFPLPDEHYADPYFIGGSDACNVLWARAGSWSAHHLTDGHVPVSILQTLHRNAEQAAAELVQCGIWRRARGGFQFVDWPKIASRAYVEAKREGNRTRQARHQHGLRTSATPLSRHDSRVTNGVTNSVIHGVVDDPQSSPVLDTHLGGERPVGDRARPDRPPDESLEQVSEPPGQPPDRCYRHRSIPPGQPVPACGACGEARRAKEAWVERSARTERNRRAAERAAIRACPFCDGEGFRYEFGRRVLVMPYQKCDHTELSADS